MARIARVHQGPYQVSVSRNTMKQLGVVKKQLIPVEQSRKVWIPQLLRTSKSSTHEVYVYLYIVHVSRTALVEYLTQYRKAESSLWSYLLEVFT